MKKMIASKGPVALLYQAIQPPTIGGINKPLKPGGYSDSGADIAYVLASELKIPVITPVDQPSTVKDLDWVFPDSTEGIEQALKKGAKIIWANTVLFSSHPLQGFLERQKNGDALLRDVSVVCQMPKDVERFDDKFATNVMLREHECPVARSFLVSLQAVDDYEGQPVCVLDHVTESVLKEKGMEFPIIIKPIRGRGSEGVTKVDNLQQFIEKSTQLLTTTVQFNDVKLPKYGTILIVEEFLQGDELTLTIMPPGNYLIQNKPKTFTDYWSLPPVKRFNHQNGVAPYNGIVAVIHNSRALSPHEIESSAPIQTVTQACTRAAFLVNSKAPIRIDCRATTDGTYKLFDLNMKPNMTGRGRPGREEQDSLSAIAAREIGWNYSDLLYNIMLRSWQC